MIQIVYNIGNGKEGSYEFSWHDDIIELGYRLLEKAFYRRTITRRPKITQQTKYKSIKFKST